MRLWQLTVAVVAVAIGLTLWRDPLTRTMVIVLLTGVGELGVGLAAVMALFQTIGALGEAKTLHSHVEALLATTVIVGLATALMSGCLFVGFYLVEQFV